MRHMLLNALVWTIILCDFKQIAIFWAKKNIEIGIILPCTIIKLNLIIYKGKLDKMFPLALQQICIKHLKT